MSATRSRPIRAHASNVLRGSEAEMTLIICSTSRLGFHVKPAMITSRAWRLHVDLKAVLAQNVGIFQIAYFGATSPDAEPACRLIGTILGPGATRQYVASQHRLKPTKD